MKSDQEKLEELRQLYGVTELEELCTLYAKTEDGPRKTRISQRIQTLEKIAKLQVNRDHAASKLLEGELMPIKTFRHNMKIEEARSLDEFLEQSPYGHHINFIVGDDGWVGEYWLYVSPNLPDGRKIRGEVCVRSMYHDTRREAEDALWKKVKEEFNDLWSKAADIIRVSPTEPLLQVTLKSGLRFVQLPGIPVPVHLLPPLTELGSPVLASSEDGCES